MRIARLSSPEGPRYARLDGNVAHLLAGAPWLGRGATVAGAPRAWTDADLLCPVEPSKIVCVGSNYAAHEKELGNEVPAEPLLFLKPPSSLLGPGGAVILPKASARVEHEAELTVVMGARARDVAAAEAMRFVFGFTAANDVTARDLQRKDGQWTRAKGFDTFCPVGPWVETDLVPEEQRVQCLVNGATRQDGKTADMIFDVPTIIAYVSRIMTLEPGDIILTGTPEGVSPLVDGDECVVDIRQAAGVGEPLVLRSVFRGS